MTEQVKVTQADVERKLRWQQRFLTEGIGESELLDEEFARHRIAAQAELLEALEFLANAARATKGFASPMALQQADAAIAKAKGEA